MAELNDLSRNAALHRLASQGVSRLAEWLPAGARYVLAAERVAANPAYSDELRLEAQQSVLRVTAQVRDTARLALSIAEAIETTRRNKRPIPLPPSIVWVAEAAPVDTQEMPSVMGNFVKGEPRRPQTQSIFRDEARPLLDMNTWLRSPVFDGDTPRFLKLLSDRMDAYRSVRKAVVGLRRALPSQEYSALIRAVAAELSSAEMFPEFGTYGLPDEHLSLLERIDFPSTEAVLSTEGYHRLALTTKVARENLASEIGKAIRPYVSDWKGLPENPTLIGDALLEHARNITSPADLLEVGVAVYKTTGFVRDPADRADKPRLFGPQAALEYIRQLALRMTAEGPTPGQRPAPVLPQRGRSRLMRRGGPDDRGSRGLPGPGSGPTF